jgi:hypothetical protein
MMHRQALIMVVSASILVVQAARGDEPSLVGRKQAAKPPASKVPANPVDRLRPKTAGTDNDPLIQLEGSGAAGEKGHDALLACLNQLPWASRTAVLPAYRGAIAKDRWLPKATAAVALGERQWADIADLANRIRKAGFAVSAIHLTGFGTVRIRAQFGPLGGETVELAEGKKKRAVLAPTNPARQRIQAVYGKLPWLVDAKFTAAGTKPDFNLAKDKAEVRAEFVLADSQVIEVAALLDGLTSAGFPPKALRVARMFAGVPFGFPIPGDVELVDSAGAKLASGQLQKPGRPLVLVFFSLTGKYKQGKEEEKTYRAALAHFARLKETTLKYANRADFVAISSPKGDSSADVAALWQKAALPFPFYRDAEQRLATALSAGLHHPPPHIFILDSAGRLRYAGDFADQWIKPEKTKRVYLADALDLVLANKYADNGAAFNNSAPCSCSAPGCQCPKCGCGGPCRCGCSTGAG